MIITGCSRSGTMSIAQIFGIHHEVQFTPRLGWSNLSQVSIRLRSEASWLAAPFVAELRTPIIHLVRHPLAVINSLLGIEFWTQDGHKPYRDFLEKFCPTTGDSIQKSLIYWYEWNKSLSNYPRMRLEDWTSLPQLNSRKRFVEAGLQWSDIPDSKYKNTVKTLAKEYGYE